MQAFGVLSEEQRLLTDSAEDFLSKNSNCRLSSENDAILWQQITELGWAAVHIPEKYGGLGLGFTEVGLLQRIMGWHLFRSPFFTNVVLAQTIIIEAASEEAKQNLLPLMATGQSIGTLISSKGLNWPYQSLEIKARRSKQGWVLNGTASQVLDSNIETFSLVVAELEDGGCALFNVPADREGIERNRLDVWDFSKPQSSWSFNEVNLSSKARVDDSSSTAPLQLALQRCHAYFALMHASEQLGGASRCIELTRQYTAERKQFGRSIASFQAVKHRCAQMLIALEQSHSAVQGVLSEIAELSESELLQHVAIARVQSSECYRFCSAEAIQLHGGVGFTWEYDPQLHFKRAQWGSQWFGSTDFWRDEIADRLFGDEVE